MNPIRRFQYLVENTDWDQRLLQHERILNGFCWGLMAFAVCFFTYGILMNTICS